MSAPSRRRPFLLGLAVVLLLVILDQWSKDAIYGWLRDGMAAGMETDVHGHRRYPVAGEWLSFMTSCNAGAAFGQFDQHPEILVGGRVLAVLFLTYLLHQTASSQRWTYGAMVLVLAGAIGNLVDNLATGCGTSAVPHGVRDFVNVWFEPLFGWDYHFPSFNLADACISVGAVIWVTSGFFGGDGREEEVAEATAGEPGAGGPGPAGAGSEGHPRSGPALASGSAWGTAGGGSRGHGYRAGDAGSTL